MLTKRGERECSRSTWLDQLMQMRLFTVTVTA